MSQRAVSIQCVIFSTPDSGHILTCLHLESESRSVDPAFEVRLERTFQPNWTEAEESGVEEPKDSRRKPGKIEEAEADHGCGVHRQASKDLQGAACAGRGGNGTDCPYFGQDCARQHYLWRAEAPAD